METLKGTNPMSETLKRVLEADKEALLRHLLLKEAIKEVDEVFACVPFEVASTSKTYREVLTIIENASDSLHRYETLLKEFHVAWLQSIRATHLARKELGMYAKEEQESA